jgi:rhodanese-related sulfurtransferase
MAIWACGDATRNDRLASLANLVVLRRFDDLLCAGCALRKVAIRHSCLIPDCFLWLNTVSRTWQAFPLRESGLLSIMRKRFVLLSALVLATAAFAGSFPDISLESLKKAIADKDVAILDVNGAETYKRGHIPGAIDFISNRADIASKLPSDKDALIVAYCLSEGCSAYARAAEAAKHLGYNNVKRFAPGLAGWNAAGEPLQKGQ